MNPLRKITAALEGARASFDNLSERERRLVTIMGGLGFALVFFLPLFLVWSSMMELESDNERIREVLSQVRNSGPAIAERMAARAETESLFTNSAPPLGTFLESKAREAGYASPLQMTEEPDRVEGGFRRAHTRASFTAVGLAPLLRMLASIKNSPYPMAVERIQVEHFQAGDKYNAEVGIFAFAKEGGAPSTSGGSAEPDEPASEGNE